MADIESNIKIGVDADQALRQLKLLQRQLSAFYSTMAKSGAAGAAVSQNMAQNLTNQINASGKFYAEMKKIKTTTDSFNEALEKNKFGMKEYFRYAGASTKTFGKLFKTEFDTINKVARENVKTLQTQYIKMGRDASGALKAMSIRPLTLDMNDYATKTAMAAQRQALLNQLLRQGSTNLLNFGKNTQWAGRQLMVGFTVPLMYFGSVAAKTFMELEEQAIRFKRVYGDMFTNTKETTEALQNVKMLANEFTKYGVAVADTMKMAADVAATGKVGNDLLVQVAQANKLAVLGGIDQQKSLDTLISLTSTFGITAEKTAQQIDFLNAVENQTILSIDDLTTAIPKAAPVIKQLGGDVQDLAFFMTAMREGGIQAGEGANALKSGLASIINPSKRASEFLASFGINIKGIVDANQGDVKKLVIDVASALDKLDPLNRARAIEQLFGKFQFSRISTLFQNVIKEGTQAQTVAELTTATVEELAILSERELNKISESPMYKFKKQVQDLKTVIAPIGAEFLKALTPIIEFFNKILRRFEDMSDGTKKFVVYLTTILAGIGPLALMSFGLLANGVANIIKLFVSIKSVFNRAGNSTTYLGEQTNYLTQAQINAAAVASSLDQAHMTLTQRFTAEAQAVKLLRNAYMEANAASLNFSIGTGIAKTPGMPLANGILSVPGPKGAGDVVPAMLSPGEAVIPAKQNKKFGGLIRGIIADKIPGFIKGSASIKTVNFGGTDYSNIATNAKTTESKLSEYLHRYSTGANATQETNVQLTKMLETLNQRALAEGKTQILSLKQIQQALAEFNLREINPKGTGRQSAGSVFAHGSAPRRATQEQLNIINQEGQRLISQNPEYHEKTKYSKANMLAQAESATMYNRYGFNTDHSYNTGSGDTKLFQSEFLDPAKQTKVMSPFYEEWAAQQGKTLNEVLKDPKLFKKMTLDTSSFAKAIGEEIGKIGTETFSDDQFYKAVADAEAKHFAKGSSGKLKRPRMKRVVDALKEDYSTLGLMGGEANRATGQRVGVAQRDQELRQQLGMPLSGKPYKRGGQYASISQKVRQKSIDYGFTQIGDSFSETLDARSPSKKLRKIGKDAGTGLLLGVKESVKDAKGAGRQLAMSVIQGSMQIPQSKLTTMNRGIVGPTSPYNPGGNDNNKPTTKNRGRVGVGGLAMGANALLMGGSMMPGQVGDMSQKLMMPVMALSMILPLLQSKFGLLTVGIAALTYAIVSTRMAFDKAQDSAMKLAENLGSGAKAMEELAKFSGKVSATEIMDKRRKNSLSPFQVQTGKTTFGQSFVDSDLGKQTISAVTDSMKVGGRAGAQSQLLSQLTTGVVTGSLTADQARSIAANIGEQLGDYSFGIQVNAKMLELLGPNGENLEKDPIAIRVKLMQDARQKANSATGMIGNAARYTGKDTAKFGGFGLGGLIGGGALAVGGGMASAVAGGAAAGSFVPGIGTAIGAGAGALIGGTLALRDRQKRIGAASGGAVAMQKMALEQQTAMMDSLELEYEKRIDIAKAANDLEKVARLTAEREAGRIALLEENKGLLTDIGASYSGASSMLGGNVQKAMMTGVDKAITNQYKDTAMADIVPLAQTAIGGSGATKEQQYKIKMEMASGNIDPMQIVSMFEMFKEDQGSVDALLDITANFGGKFANQAISTVSMFTNKDGSVNKTAQAKFIADIKTKTPKEAEKMLTFFGDITKTGEVLDVGVAVEYLQKNPNIANNLQETIANIKAQKGKISLEVAATILGAKEMEALRSDQEYFNSLPAEQQKVYLQTLTTMAEVTGNNSKEFLAWQAANPGQSPNKYFTGAAQQLTKAEALATPATGEDGSETGTGPTSSPLDELVKKIRDTRKATEELTTGWDSSASALKRMAKEGIEGFKGLSQTLRSQGANQNTIDFITALSPEDYNKYKSLFKDMKTLQSAINFAELGSYQDSQEKIIADTDNQTIAFNKLVAAGMDSATAYEAVQNTGFAAAVATEKLGKNMKKIVDTTTAANRKKIEGFLKMGQYSQAFDPGYNLAQRYFDVQEKLMKLRRQAEIDQQQAVIDTADIQIKSAQNIQDVNNYQISTYEDGLKTIDDQANEITKKYDKQFESLDKISKINETIARQEKGRLSLAEALSQGDIYAAARAAQELRAQNAADAIAQQRTGMESARDAQISALTGNGLTRDQLEEKIKALKEQNYRIDQDTIKPLQEQSRLAQVKLDLINQEVEAQAKNLTLAGMTKKEWETQATKIEAAQVATELYNGVLQGSLDAINKMNAGWQGILDKLGQYVGTNLPSLPDGTTTTTTTTDSGTSEKPPKGIKSPGVVSKPSTPSSVINKKFPTVTSANIMGSGSGFGIGSSSSNKIMGGGKTLAPQTWQQAVAKAVPKKWNMGGRVQRFASGGFAIGTDTVPAMLTPGEFIVSKYGVDKFGVDNLRAINKGDNPSSSSVYNYNLSVNVKSDANPNEIARTVMMQIKQIDSQRIKGNRI
jgi:TP901 family phage tail tape measure protein